MLETILLYLQKISEKCGVHLFLIQLSQCYFALLIKTESFAHSSQISSNSVRLDGKQFRSAIFSSPAPDSQFVLGMDFD